VAELPDDKSAVIRPSDPTYHPVDLCYLRKIKGPPNARGQLTAFLTSLFKVVESSPRAALVYTLAVGKDSDAYSDDNQFIADKKAEAEIVSARKATLLNPTEDDETVRVLRRRLFARIDDSAASAVIEEYRALWHNNRDALAPDAIDPETLAAPHSNYPLHPDVLTTFTRKSLCDAGVSQSYRFASTLSSVARRLKRFADWLPN
jgi:uncharacterized protein (DUF2267 family)